MKHTNLPRTLAALLLAGLLAACAEPDRDDSGPGQGGATTVPTTLPGNAPATEPTRPAGELTVTGTVREGVEPDCLLLEAEQGGPYLLIGGPTPTWSAPASRASRWWSARSSRPSHPFRVAREAPHR
jgi:hypothetical protein